MVSFQDMALRILAAWFASLSGDLGPVFLCSIWQVFGGPRLGFPSCELQLLEPQCAWEHARKRAREPQRVSDHFCSMVLKLNDYFCSHIRAVGAASTVLLKNSNKILPLSKPKSIAIIGNGAGPSSRGPNGCVDQTCSCHHLIHSSNQVWRPWWQWWCFGNGYGLFVMPSMENLTCDHLGWGSGTANYPYLIDVSFKRISEPFKFFNPP